MGLFEALLDEDVGFCRSVFAACLLFGCSVARAVRAAIEKLPAVEAPSCDSPFSQNQYGVKKVES
jgi:hypothetical protein